jgi:class 3 adenylate cyclase/tetratricopeptide (TPR) repeat protein
MNPLYYKYLPVEAVNRLESESLTFSQKEELLKEYNNLLRNISTYIPQNVVLSYTEKTGQGVRQGRCLEGTLVFADVSGFTALTEELGKHGNAGVEEISRVLNELFSAMIRVIFKYKGILVKYGGDAMMIFFSSEENFCGKQHGENGLRCAMEMQEEMMKFADVDSPYGNFSLSMSIGIHSGEFLEVISGDPAIHREYFLTGPHVEKTAAIEGKAASGEVFTDAETLDKVREHVAGFHQKQDGFVIEAVREKEFPPVTQSLISIDYDQIDELLKAMDDLSPYLMRGVFDKVRSSVNRLILEGENRPLTVMFINFYLDDKKRSSLSSQEVGTLLAKYVNTVQDAVSHYDGSVNKVDMYDRGDKIMVTFGFPRSHADDNERALRCARDIMEQGSVFLQQGLHQKIGISSGFIFCGNAGSPLRKEYTFLGDTVNTAARIMSHAGAEEAWFSESVYLSVKEMVKIKKSQQKQFKGKSAAQKVYQLGGIHKVKQEEAGIFIGRHDELKKLGEWYEKTGSEFFLVQITGGAGIGKTFLLNKFLNGVTTPVLRGRGNPYGTEIQYGAVKEILSSLLGLTKGDDEESIHQKILTYIEKYNLKELNFSYPLVESLFSEKGKDHPVLEIENPIEKKELFFNTAHRLLEGRGEPLILVFEDGEWIDEATLEWVNFLIRKKGNLFCLVLSRNELPLREDYPVMPLREFSKEETLRFIEEFPHIKNVPRETGAYIHEKSHGNPYYIYEILLSMREKGLKTQLPDSIHRSILSRMDLLPEKERALLQIASVLGTEFPFFLLTGLTDGKDLEGRVKNLEENDFIQETGDERYAFKNMMVREVAYETLSARQKKRLHLKTASLLEEREDRTRYFELLVYHYEQAGIPEKTLYYLNKSGDNAFRLNNYKKALEYYRKAQELMEKMPESFAEAESEIYRKVGKILIIAGKNREAHRMYQKAFSLSTEQGFQKDMAESLLNLGIIDIYDGKRESALANFEKARAIYSQIEDGEGLAKTFLNLGTLYKQSGDFNRAISIYREALVIFQEMEDEQGCADVYNNLGNFSAGLFRFKEAQEYYNKALEIYGKKNQARGLSIVRNNMGTLYIQEGNGKKALEAFEESLEGERKIGNDRGAAVSLNNLGNAAVLLREWEKADDYYSRGLNICENIRDTKKTADIYLNRGVLYYYRKQIQTALGYLKNAEDLYERLSEPSGLYTVYYNMALLYEEDGIGETAVDYYAKGLETARQLETKTYLEALVNKAGGESRLNLLSDARKTLEEGLAGLKVASSKLTEVYRMLAGVYTRLGELEKAEEIQRELITVYGTNELPEEQSYGRVALSEILEKREKPDEALEEIERAYAYFEEKENLVGRVYCLTKMGSFHYGRKDYETALKNLEEAISIFRTMDYELGEAEFLKQMGIIYTGMDKYRAAEQYFEESLKLEEKMRFILEAGETYYLLGLLKIKEADYSRAAGYLEKSLEKNRENRKETSFLLGQVYDFMGEEEKAIGVLEICAGFPNDRVALEAVKKLVLLYEKRRDREKMREALRRLWLEEPDRQEKALIKKMIREI